MVSESERLAEFAAAVRDSTIKRLKEVTIWWIIVRGNLDHETHHRGQLSVYLKPLS
jgi:uncharacterized damage-inducible protein DinB